MKTDPRHRYPGVAPFSTSQKEIFFGREEEAKRLAALISTEQQVLLYAKSGLGKSSLINAGVIPQLATQPNALILSVRIGAYQDNSSKTPLEAVHATLPQAPDTLLEQVLLREGSLWQHFKSIALATKKPLRFYLIFDQFEELFTHPKESIFAFKKQMADLLYRVVPRHFRAVLEIKQRADPNILDDTQLQRLNQAMDLHVLYAIREDRYSYLNRLSDYLPDLLHTRFQLNPLTRANAEAAITLPASIKTGFDTAPFRYSTWALSSILDYLTKGQQQVVETTQLQILCSLLEKLHKPEIRKEDIPSFDDIFLEFYYDCIQALPETIRNRAQAFIEEELIKSKQRIALDRLACLEHLSDEVLDRLLRDRHLLRAEQNSTGGSSLEISHDTLVAPILQARAVRQARLAEEARTIEGERLRHELERVKGARLKTRRQLRRTRTALVVALIGAFVASGAVIYAMEQKRQAILSEEDANRGKAIADSLRDVAEDLKSIAEEQIKKYKYYEYVDSLRKSGLINEQLAKANTYELTDEPELAIEAVDSALKLDPRRPDLVKRRAELWKNIRPKPD